MRQPYDPDPLHVPEQPVARICGCGDPEPHVHAVIPLLMASALIVIVVLLVVAAASRSASEYPAPVQTGAPTTLPADAAGLGTAGGGRDGVSGEDTPMTNGTRPASEGAAASLIPLAATPTWSGTATWYCGAGSRCPRGHGPGELIAAIDRKDSPFRKGDRVTVTYHCGGRCVRSVDVRIVDVCACGGARLIDLSARAFRRLAPLGLGVIPVELTAAGASPTLPPTDR